MNLIYSILILLTAFTSRATNHDYWDKDLKATNSWYDRTFMKVRNPKAVIR